jgi:hypothetical protein
MVTIRAIRGPWMGTSIVLGPVAVFVAVFVACMNDE